MDLIKANEGEVIMVGEFQGQPVERNVAEQEDWKQWTGAFIDESFLIDSLRSKPRSVEISPIWSINRG